MTSKYVGPIMALLAMAVLSAPAMGQRFSDSYSFIKAVRERDGAKVEAMAARPGSTIVNSVDSDSGDTGLHIVARERDLLWLRFLLSHGAVADVQNREGQTPLSLATQIGWTEGVRALLAGGAKVDYPNNLGETALIIAVQRRNVPLVQLLLSEGADPRKTDRVTGYSAMDYAERDRRSAGILKMLKEQRATGRSAIGPSL